MYRLLMLSLLCVSATVVAKSPANNANTFADTIYMLPGADLKHAAELGDVDSQFQLGWQYSTKEDDQRIPTLSYSPRLAEYWYREAARQGHAPSAYNMAVILAQGRGVTVDVEEAYAWLDLAAGLGHEPSKQLHSELMAGLSDGQLSSIEALQRRLIPRNVLTSAGK